MTAVVAALTLAACGTGSGPTNRQSGPVSAPAQPVLLSTADSSTSFELQNTADVSLEWEIDVDHDSGNPTAGDWFDVSPSSGVLGPLESQIVTLLQRSGLPPGSYLSTMRVLYPGGETLLEVSGEVDGDGSWEEGDVTISGTLSTVNAGVPIDPPSGYAGTLSALSSTPRQDEGGRLLVELRDGARSLSASDSEGEAVRLAERVGAELLRSSGGEVLLRLPAGVDPSSLRSALAADPRVAAVHASPVFRLHGVPTDPLTDHSWQLPIVGAPLAWEAPLARRLPVVAVIDSSFDVDHEDLQGVFLAGFDFCGASECSRRDSNPRPDFGGDAHGTHVAGLLAATADNGRGLAGIIPAGARIVPIKAFYDDYTDEFAIAEAIRWAAGGSIDGVPANPNPANIITLSLGASGDSSHVREAVEFAVSRGTLVVASAGNEGHSSIDYPARYPDVLAVGSVNSRLERSCFSDYGTGLDFMAPGGDGFICAAEREEGLISTSPGDDYRVDAGTSMAAPIVAAAAAITWASLPLGGAEAVRQRLAETAYFDGGYMTAATYGAGVVRLDRAVGFPGPGDLATVQAVGPGTAIDTVKLDPYGGSAEFVLDGLAAGRYSIEAEARGRSLELAASVDIDAPGDRTIELPLGP